MIYIKFAAVLLIYWGMYSIFNRYYTNIRHGNSVDLGVYHVEAGVIEVLIGMALLYYVWIKR